MDDNELSGEPLSGTFTLSIRLGNDAMQTAGDLGEVVAYVSERLDRGDTEGGIHDAYGNRVGSFEVKA